MHFVTVELQFKGACGSGVLQSAYGNITQVLGAQGCGIKFIPLCGYGGEVLHIALVALRIKDHL